MTKQNDGNELKYFTIQISTMLGFVQTFHGRRDGKRGLPDVKDLDEHEQVPPTPHDMNLLGRQDDATKHEHGRLIEQSYAKCEEIVGCMTDIITAAKSIRDAETALTGANGTMTQSDLSTRRPGEQGIDAAGIARRRQRERAKTVAPLSAKVEQAKRVLDTHFKRLAQVETSLTNDVRKAQARAARYCGFTDSLRARYWRALVRVHPDKTKLIGHVPPHVAVPGWITESDYRVVLGVRLPDGWEDAWETIRARHVTQIAA